MQIIKAPNPIPASGGLYHATPMVFLAGSIEMGAAEDWQDRIAREMQDLDVTFLNPRRDNWDSSWTQSIDNPQFRQQVEWELDALERCDIIACYIDPTTKSPITLMEIGLHAKAEFGISKLRILCPEGFYRKGNIDVTAAFYEIPTFKDWKTWTQAIREELEGWDDFANLDHLR
jgi:hypothetical protein